MLQLDQLAHSVKEHLTQLKRNDVAVNKWIIADSHLSGRGILATKDIMAGEVIFVDHPLLYGPRSGNAVQRGCTVCRNIDRLNSFKCSTCALLLCSERCQNTQTHLNDCSVISSWTKKVPIEDVDGTVLSKALTPIRALLLDCRNKELLSALQGHVFPRHGVEVRALKEFFDIPPEDEQLMTLACCVLDANAFQIASTYGKDDMSLRGLYPVASLMNHACVPNTRHSFDRTNCMVVKASKFIPSGAEISSCYSCLLWGTPARRHHLNNTKHFLCTCERCADPTEYGTQLAALKCFYRDCPGSLLPKEPLKVTSTWRCTQCSVVVPANQIGAIQSALGSLLTTLDFENPIQIEDFILNRMPKYIPRTNQILLDLKCRLIWMLGEMENLHWNQLSESRLSLKEALCRETLRTVAALGAGDAHLRGLLLYHLHATLAERARRRPDHYEELKPEIETTIEQAYKILEGDISAPSDLELRRKYLGPGCDKSTEERLFILDV